MSFNQATQTLEELIIMEQFRNAFPGFPKGKLTKSESPDFILKPTAKTTFGIELTKLHGSAVKKEKTHYPSRIAGYHPPEFNRENIAHTIQAKNEKLPIYQQKKLNQIWLLITADLNQSPVSFNLNNKLENWTFVSGFHRIFLFELKNRKVYELKIVN